MIVETVNVSREFLFFRLLLDTPRLVTCVSSVFTVTVWIIRLRGPHRFDSLIVCMLLAGTTESEYASIVNLNLLRTSQAESTPARATRHSAVSRMESSSWLSYLESLNIM